MAQVLACSCKDCTHWEIISHPAARASVLWGVLEKITPAHPALTSILKCKTCGKEFAAFVRVDPHADLTEVERQA